MASFSALSTIFYDRKQIPVILGFIPLGTHPGIVAVTLSWMLVSMVSTK
jgi:hypothetical protein